MPLLRRSMLAPALICRDLQTHPRQLEISISSTAQTRERAPFSRRFVSAFTSICYCCCLCPRLQHSGLKKNAVTGPLRLRGCGDLLVLFAFPSTARGYFLISRHFYLTGNIIPPISHLHPLVDLLTPVIPSVPTAKRRPFLNSESMQLAITTFYIPLRSFPRKYA